MKKFYHISFWIALILVFFSSSAFVPVENQEFNSFYENFDKPLNKIELTEDIVHSGCSACHMEYSMDGKTMSPSPVHKPRHIQHKERIQHFVNTHNQGQAEEKTIDLNKLIAYLETLD